MLAIDGTFLDFKQLDLLALGKTTVHRLDPRAKILTTGCFILCVVSFDRYTISAMLPFLLFPAVMLAAGELPVGYILRKVLMVIPFALAVGILNPIFDRQVLMRIGPLDIWGGWISCTSILMRATLTAGAAIILVGLTGLPAICRALETFGMPRVFAVQLLFLYRYIFVLTDEGVRTLRAYRLRSCSRRKVHLGQFGSLVGILLLRTWARAERIHRAMLARGFAGRFPPSAPPSRFGRAETVFTLGWVSLFILLRMVDLPLLLGSFLVGALP